MKIVLDESVCYGLAEILRKAGYKVVAIAEVSTSGITDVEVFNLVRKSNGVLITRDYHFTNPLRFPPNKIGGVIYIRHVKIKTVSVLSSDFPFIINGKRGQFVCQE